MNIFVVKRREMVMAWWNGLTNLQKYTIITRNVEDFPGIEGRQPSSLTGREIEELYIAEEQEDEVA